MVLVILSHLLPIHSRTPSDDPHDFVLPLNNPDPFPDVFNQKFLFVPAIHAPIIFVILLFPISTVFIWFCLSTLPISLQSWPRTLTDLATLGRELHGYSQSGNAPMAHVIAVMSITYVWKHAWSIPGSVVWNVLAGALLPSSLATLLLTTLTALGSLCATLLATPLSPILSQLFPRALDLTRAAIKGSSDSTKSSTSTSTAWVRLSVLRLIGVVPWSGINVACGVCGVPIPDVVLGAFIGTMPWTAVTCQIGDILQTVASSPPTSTPQTVSSLLASPEIILKLACLSFLSLAPILARDHLRAWIALGAVWGEEERERRTGRWAWSGRIRLGSKSRTRAREREVLEVLVREKEAMFAEPVQAKLP